METTEETTTTEIAVPELLSNAHSRLGLEFGGRIQKMLDFPGALLNYGVDKNEYTETETMKVEAGPKLVLTVTLQRKLY